MRWGSDRAYQKKSTYNINVEKSFFEKTSDLLKFLTVVFALTGGLISVIEMYRKNEWALAYADYYGFHRALSYDKNSNLGLISKTLTFIIFLAYCLPSIICFFKCKNVKLDDLDIVLCALMNGIGVFIFLISLDLESFFYDKYPINYNTITNDIYKGVPLLLCIITFFTLTIKFKDKKYIRTSRLNLDDFRDYYSTTLIIASLIASFIIYLILPGYTKPKDVNTYPVVKNSIREDKTFDVLISNLDGGRAIFMPASIDGEKKETDGLNVIKFTKYKYFVDTLDKKEFILTTFAYNEVEDLGEDNNLFDILYKAN